MKKYVVFAIILSCIAMMIFSGCSRAVKSGDRISRDMDYEVDPFDYGDEFLHLTEKRQDSEAGKLKSGKDDSDKNKISSIPPDYLNNQDKRSSTDVPEQGSNMNILGYRVQIGAFENKENAEKTAESARLKFDLPVYITYQAPFYRVRIGDFVEKREAEIYVKEVKEKGFSDARWVPTSINTQ